MVGAGNEERIANVVKEINNAYKRITPNQITFSNKTNKRLNTSSRKFRSFKKKVDLLYLSTLKCSDRELFPSIALFVEYIELVRSTRFTRSYTYVLMRLMALLLSEPIKSKLPDIVKVELLHILKHFIVQNALYKKNNGMLVPNRKNPWYVIFLHNHAYAFASLCVDYENAYSNIINKT